MRAGKVTNHNNSPGGLVSRALICPHCQVVTEITASSRARDNDSYNPAVPGKREEF